MGNDLGAFRGHPVFHDAGFGTGGNTGMAKETGKVGVGSMSTSQWHPTVMYLVGLLIVEWVALGFIVKFF